MSRLPQPGSDKGNWGEILNDYLQQSHDATGILKTQSVTSAILADAAVTSSKLANGLIAPVGLSGSYTDLTAKPTIPTAAADINAEPAGLSTTTKAQLTTSYSAVDPTSIAMVYADAAHPDLPTSVTVDGITTTYGYDTNGNPITKTRLGVTRTFTYVGTNLVGIN